MNMPDTTKYSLAIFNCAVLAVLTFFFPLHHETNIWLCVLYYFLLLFTNVVYMSKDELKKKGKSRNVFENIAYMDTYIIEVVMIAYIVIRVICMSEPQEKLDLRNLCDAYFYLFVFVLNMEYSVMGMVAGAKGKRALYVPYLGLALGIACMVLFYVEIAEDGIQLPKYVQPLCCLTLIPSLFRLRIMESYGHF